MLRFLQREIFLAEAGIDLGQNRNGSGMFWFNGQTLGQDGPGIAEGGGSSSEIVSVPGNRSLEPGLRIIEAEIDLLKILPGRRRKKVFRFRVVAIDQGEHQPDRGLPTRYVHLRRLGQGVAQRFLISSSIEDGRCAAKLNDWH